MLRIKSHVRPGFVLMVGVLLGGMAVVMAPAAARLTGGQPDGAEGVIIKTRTASCAGVAFYPMQSGSGYSFDEGVMRYGSGLFSCNPGLPSKATVTKVVFDVFDNSGDGEAGECGLWRLPVDASSGVFEMAYVSGTGLEATPGRVLLTDTSIQGNPTNNAVASYVVWCALDQVSVFSLVGLWGASITYTISAGNG